MNGPRSLKAWRKRAGETVTHVAELLGVKHPTLLRWESGSRPSLGHQLAIESLTEGAVRVESWGTDDTVVTAMRAAVARREAA